METNYNLEPGHRAFPKWLLMTFGVLVTLFVALSVIGKWYDVSKNFKSTKPENTISITAEGKVSAEPDLATVNLGVLTQGPTAAGVQDQNSKKVNQIIDFVKQQGIPKEDITTTQFNIYPQYDYKDGRNNVIGYQANQTVTVKVKGKDVMAAKVGKILDGATDNGANEIAGVNFGFDNPDNLKQDARKLAIANAKDKAAELASEAGLKLGKVVSIQESGGYYPMPLQYGREAFSKGADSAAPSIAPNIQPGSQDITASITIVFEVK